MRTVSPYGLPAESLEDQLYPFGQKLETLADFAFALCGWRPNVEPSQSTPDLGATADPVALEALVRSVEMLRVEWAATHAAIYESLREAARAGGNADRVFGSISPSMIRQPEAIIAD
jgi:hypothetical protein